MTKEEFIGAIAKCDDETLKKIKQLLIPAQEEDPQLFVYVHQLVHKD